MLRAAHMQPHPLIRELDSCPHCLRAPPRGGRAGGRARGGGGGGGGRAAAGGGGGGGAPGGGGAAPGGRARALRLLSLKPCWWAQGGHGVPLVPP
jgi:hypothetical protein